MEYESPVSDEYQLTPESERLNVLLNANAEIARLKALKISPRDEFEISIMTRPIGSEAAYRYLGIMLGSLPPATIFLLYALKSNHFEIWAVALLLWVSVVTTAAGYSSGHIVGRAAASLGFMSRSARVLLLPFIGFVWGVVCGAAGGVFIFVIGALFGAIIGGAVGAVAVSVFYPLHRLASTAGTIELKHLLPISAGITLSICALIARL